MITHIKIPELPPTDNHLYGWNNRRKFMYKAGKDWKALAHLMAKQSYKGEVDTENKFYLAVIFYLKRDRDTHGSLKVLYDSFEGAIYENDKQGIGSYQEKRKDKDNPRVEVFVFKDKKKMLNYLLKL